MVSDDGQATHEIEARVKKASVAFGMLRERVWQSHCIRLQTKLAIYKAVVLSTLLYGCETWTCYRKDIATLDSFHMRHLRTILGVKWQDFVTNAQVLRRCDMTGIEAYILHHRLRWCGHVMRMEVDRLPRMLLLSELAAGKRDLRHREVCPQSLFPGRIIARRTIAPLAMCLFHRSTKRPLAMALFHPSWS